MFQPSGGLGAGRWAAHAIIVAAAMTYFAERAARQDGDDLRRAAILGLAALTMISFALILMLSEVALTLALAVMVLLRLPSTAGSGCRRWRYSCRSAQSSSATVWCLIRA